jgi:deoxycytidylate deaminase
MPLSIAYAIRLNVYLKIIHLNLKHIMTLKFPSGDLEQLKLKLISVIPTDSWKPANENTYQAKVDRCMVSFYHTTGTIMIQGKDEFRVPLESRINQLLKGESESPVSNKSEESNNNQISSSNVNNDSTPEIQGTNLNSDNDNQKEVYESKTSEIISFEEVTDSEIVIALVGGLGVEYHRVVRLIKERLGNVFSYNVHEVRVSQSVISDILGYDDKKDTQDKFEYISYYMSKGNESRKIYDNNAVLAVGASKKIAELRGDSKRNAYIINSLKHPDEVKFLREVYGRGFYLVGAFADDNSRAKYLRNDLGITDSNVAILMERDKDKESGHGQHTSDTFHLSDFFVYVDSDEEKLKNGINRFIDIVFGSPHLTPTFEEYAMFLAFTSALRSADLSRQVGAVIAQENEIIATGANDTPKYGGGLYWPLYDESLKQIVDFDNGRDYMKGEDSNIIEKNKIIDNIMSLIPESPDRENIRKALVKSQLKDITEYGRVVHAEMEALLACARNQISAKGAVLYCTTFPCHNCAKHIIAAGISRVLYVEPYAKSKALDFHPDSIKYGFKNNITDKFVYFEPFVGIGPRKFFDLFSMNLGSGRAIVRKDVEGKVVNWERSTANVKIPLIPYSYMEREKRSVSSFERAVESKKTKK